MGPKEDSSKCKNVKETNSIIALKMVNVSIYMLTGVREGWSMSMEGKVVIKFAGDSGKDGVILGWDKGW